MNDDLDKLKTIFLTDVDEETRDENLAQITAWEKDLVASENYAGWAEHDVTLQIAKKARDTYKDIGILLATNRTLTDEQRFSCWARQDAMLLLLSLTEPNAKEELAQLQAQIKAALTATN